MDLEWDEDKRLKTLAERGLDFADVVNFDFDSVVTFEDLRSDYGEARFNSFGYLDGALCTFCWTMRGKKVRIVSMRKANDREQKKYEAPALARRD